MLPDKETFKVNWIRSVSLFKHPYLLSMVAPRVRDHESCPATATICEYELRWLDIRSRKQGRGYPLQLITQKVSEQPFLYMPLDSRIVVAWPP